VPSKAVLLTGCAWNACLISFVRSECIIEGEGKGGKPSAKKADRSISDEMKWIKATRWNWNNWREVIFRADGSFLAPAENCERQGNPECRWWADDEHVYVKCAATHTMLPLPPLPLLPPPLLLLALLLPPLPLLRKGRCALRPLTRYLLRPPLCTQFWRCWPSHPVGQR
jgi:hypothetical protein